MHLARASFYALTPAHPISHPASSSQHAENQQRWLTFWFIFTLLRFAKSMIDYVPFSSRIPFKNELWLSAIIFLAGFNGAAKLFQKYVQPFLNSHEADLDQLLDKGKEIGLALKRGKFDEVTNTGKDFANHVQATARRISTSTGAGKSVPVATAVASDSSVPVASAAPADAGADPLHRQ